MFAFRALFLSVSILSASALPASKPLSFVVHEQRDSSPKHYVSNGPADPSHRMTVRLGLKSSNMSNLEAVLYDVSTPGSKNYGNHPTKREVEALVAPSADTTTAVDKWLQSHGVQATRVSPSGDWISVNLNVSQANTLFNAKYNAYTHQVSGQQIVRTLSVSLPDSVSDHIDAVYPGTDFPSLRSSSSLMSKAKLSSKKAVSHSASSPIPRSPSPSQDFLHCNASLISPTCIRTLYGLPPQSDDQNASRILVSGFIDQFAQFADLQLYLQTFRPDVDPNITFTVQTIDGGQNIQNVSEAGTEANLDIQLTVGTTPNVPVEFLSVGDNFQDGKLDGALDMILFLLNEESPPQVVTTSYGDDEPHITASLSRKLCTAMMQLTVRGVSILFASGDGGVAGGEEGTSCTTFIPAFPANCPYITAVGGTAGVGPEIAANLSSGGFSNIFPIPEYQRAAVAGYLEQLGDVYAGLFNPLGRAYPDVSAPAVNVATFVGGEGMIEDGTSCSSPIFASVIAQVNAERLKQGKSVLGFLNPVLYANPQVFNDITSGSNPGCNTPGFPATVGWDPATGLGSPNFQKLIELP